MQLVELRLTERLTLAFQRYENARRQTEAYEKQILVNAAESLRLVRLGYDRGDPKYDYTTVLEAPTDAGAGPPGLCAGPWRLVAGC